MNKFDKLCNLYLVENKNLKIATNKESLKSFIMKYIKGDIVGNITHSRGGDIKTPRVNIHAKDDNGFTKSDIKQMAKALALLGIEIDDDSYGYTPDISFYTSSIK